MFARVPWVAHRATAGQARDAAAAEPGPRESAPPGQFEQGVGLAGDVRAIGAARATPVVAVAGDGQPVAAIAADFVVVCRRVGPRGFGGRGFGGRGSAAGMRPGVVGQAVADGLLGVEPDVVAALLARVNAARPEVVRDVLLQVVVGVDEETRRGSARPGRDSARSRRG